MRDQKPRGVPMDEWLLAIGLAEWYGVHRIGRPLAVCVADCIGTGGEWQPARIGARDVLYGEGSNAAVFEQECDYYAAGAALALAVLS